MKRIFLLLLALQTVSSCTVTKQDIWPCLQKYDANNDNIIETTEMKTMLEDKLSWYEKLMYTTTYVTNLVRADCGIPLSIENFEKESCFKSCWYLNIVKTKLC